MDENELRQKVIEIVANEAQADPSGIQPDTRIDALGVDSFGVIEIIFHCEDAFEIDLEVDELSSSESDQYSQGAFTIDCLVGAIANRIASKKTKSDVKPIGKMRDKMPQ